MKEESLIIGLALLPVILLLLYIYIKDRKRPEPIVKLLLAFFCGVVSVFLSLFVSIPLSVYGFYPEVPADFWGSLRVSLFGAALPEELAKFFMLWLLVRSSRHFDEAFDGIVYAVSVGMGFAALENLFYLWDNTNDWLYVGITRAIFSVPGHFVFGVIMGYYYSLVRFGNKHSLKNKILVILAPVFVHTIFNTILFTIDVTPLLAGILQIGFLILCILMWRYAHRRIKEQYERDEMWISTQRQNGYLPEPISVEEVELPKELEALVERMARNVHEVWAQNRLQQGWTYGPKRDDILKQHPCLVPYDELSEEEKGYDRETALSTLKLIMKLGWKIDNKSN